MSTETCDVVFIGGPIKFPFRSAIDRAMCEDFEPKILMREIAKRYRYLSYKFLAYHNVLARGFTKTKDFDLKWSQMFILVFLSIYNLIVL